MKRSELANKMVEYLEKRINCDNVIHFADQKRESDNKLLIEKNQVAFEIINYHDSNNESYNSNNKDHDKIWLENLFNTFDFITEANHTGNEYFPYLYGVLNCHNGDDSKL